MVALTNGVKAILKSYFFFKYTHQNLGKYIFLGPNYKSRQLNIFNFGAASLICLFVRKWGSRIRSHNKVGKDARFQVDAQ